jgi:ABC-type multidrug transport system permease subunit
MVGPVLYQEMLLGGRRGRQRVFRYVLAGWLLLLFVGAYWNYAIRSGYIGRLLNSGVPVEGRAAGAFADSLLEILLVQQLFLVLLATPALTAGAITDEKATGTLQYLFAADLTPWEIVVGKLLGRVAQVAVLSVCALPFLAFVGVFAGVPLPLLAAVVVVLFLPAFTVGAVSLLASVWSRQTRDAVLGVYIVGIAGFLALRYLGGLDYVNPLYALEPVWAGGSVTEVVVRLPALFITWGAVGAGCLALAGWRLHGAYLRQLEGQGRPKKPRWWRARRAAIGDEPIRWKERHVEGIAPLAALRRVPRWLGMVLVAATTILASLGILATSGRLSARQLLDHVRDLRLEDLWASFPGAADGFVVQGLVAMALATFIVGIRCSGAVTGERERQTWEALLLTPLPTNLLIRSKLWGIIGATYPYLLSYAAPALLLACVGGPHCVIVTASLLLGTWLGMAFMGAAGLFCSVRAKTSWRSLLGTMFMGYVGGFFMFVVSMPVILIVWVLLLLLFWVIDQYLGTGIAQGFLGGFGPFAIGSYLVILGLFILLTWYFVKDSEQYVADRERIRHWKDEPVVRPRRRAGIRAPSVSEGSTGTPR